MVNKMNNYYNAYEEKGNSLEYKKYGILNDHGLIIDRKTKELYDEEKITKVIRFKNELYKK